MKVGLIRIEKWNSNADRDIPIPPMNRKLFVLESMNQLTNKQCNKTMLKICKTEQWNECMSNNDHMLRAGNEMDRCSSSTEAGG